MLLASLGYRAIRVGGWWSLVLLAALLMAPFSLGLALGGEQLNRTMQVLPLVAGSVWLLLGLALPGRRVVIAVVLVAGVVLTVWHGSVNSRLFLSELTTYQNDRIIASAVVERLAAQGWDGETVPIVTVGQRATTPIGGHADDEAIGRSLFPTAPGDCARHPS